MDDKSSRTLTAARRWKVTHIRIVGDNKVCRLENTRHLAGDIVSEKLYMAVPLDVPWQLGDEVIGQTSFDLKKP